MSTHCSTLKGGPAKSTRLPLFVAMRRWMENWVEVEVELMLSWCWVEVELRWLPVDSSSLDQNSTSTEVAICQANFDQGGWRIVYQLAHMTLVHDCLSRWICSLGTPIRRPTTNYQLWGVVRGHRPADVLRVAHGGILEVELQIGGGSLRAFNKNHDHGSHTAQSSKKSQRKNWCFDRVLAGVLALVFKKKKVFPFFDQQEPQQEPAPTY